MQSEHIKFIEKKLGYEFVSKENLLTAFTHATYANVHSISSNERFEFLGDSVLNFIVTKKLFVLEDLSEGQLTVKRISLVSKKPLADAVRKMNILQYLRVGNGVSVSSFADKVISNLYEALIGAIYIDSGMRMCKCDAVISKHMQLGVLAVNFCDYKSVLKEWQEKTCQKVDIFWVEDEQDGEKFHKCELSVGDCFVIGNAHDKATAEQDASRQMLEILGQI